MQAANPGFIKSFNTSDGLREVLLFMVKLATIYLLWRVMTIFLGEEAQPIDERYWPWLSLQWERFNDLIKSNLIFFSREFLELFNYDVITSGSMVKVRGYGGVDIGNYCLALELVILFIALVVSYPAPLKHKLWFVPFGVLAIHGINIVRVVTLNMMTIYSPEYADFNHHFTFRVVVFLFILIMYYWFLKRFANRAS